MRPLCPSELASSLPFNHVLFPPTQANIATEHTDALHLTSCQPTMPKYSADRRVEVKKLEHRKTPVPYLLSSRLLQQLKAYDQSIDTVEQIGPETIFVSIHTTCLRPSLMPVFDALKVRLVELASGFGTHLNVLGLDFQRPCAEPLMDPGASCGPRCIR